MKISNKTAIILGAIVIIILILIINSYSKQAEDKFRNKFSGMMNKPATEWTQDEKEYYNNFSEWADEN